MEPKAQSAQFPGEIDDARKGGRQHGELLDRHHRRGFLDSQCSGEPAVIASFKQVGLAIAFKGDQRRFPYLKTVRRALLDLGSKMPELLHSMLARQSLHTIQD